ncbi:ATP-dependent DNA helicase [Vulcaniibacterium thermophilum]|uniref:ATP-dependent DNA helicase n=1 Tax=Vulcaniibacterium thermophilum TaxID=1169913 RepID=UPI001C958908|nr:ATP-dependent DNA helicase [Vulcaniibacterium thermophilum]
MDAYSLAAAARAALSEGGDLARAIPAFAPRAAQQDLAAAIAESIERRDALVAEAGTGTGKTFAYLVPAILSGLKTIVSTGTRALQDQLYHRDLPRVRDALGRGIRTALLKGRANYLCRYRLEKAKGEPRFTSREQIALFQRIVAWSGRTRLGDLAEIEALPDDSPLLPMVTSTAENCLGGECPFWQDCFVVQARQRAQAADLVVVNHHLLLADLALKQEGFGEILPGAQAFVVDEAHQLPELAAQFFGESLSARPLVELARDAIAECKETTGALAVVQGPARALEAATRTLRAAMEPLPVRATRQRALAVVEVSEALEALDRALEEMTAALEALRESAPGFESAHARSREFRARLARWVGRPREAVVPADGASEAQEAEAPPSPAVPAAASDHAAAEAATGPARARAGGAPVAWYELSPRGFRLSRTPLDVSGPLARHREASRAAWVFTSATLAVEGRFDHFAAKLGLVEPRTLLAPSPFDWARQALCYLPPRLPDPAVREYTRAVIDAVRPVLEASGGRAFLLFASHRALREAAEALRAGPWPLFVQGEAPRGALLQRFRESGNGVLLGTASFREGVDVAGEALSVVVIDKLPFAAPDDPVFEARLEAIRRAGGQPFRDEQLPQAVIALKQGAGRLIRTETDRGVLVLCDPRLLTKSYGRVFLDSLPPMPRTRDVGEVARFFGTGE